MSFRTLEEYPSHFVLKHADGHEVKIAKTGLSKGTLSKIKGFSGGGDVKSEPAYKERYKAMDAERQAQGATTVPNKPVIIDPTQSVPPQEQPTEQVAPEVSQDLTTPAPREVSSEGSGLSKFGELLGKHVIAPVGHAIGDTVNAYKMLGSGASNAAAEVGKGIDKGAGVTPVSATPQGGQVIPAVGDANQPPQLQNVALGNPKQVPGQTDQLAAAMSPDSFKAALAQQQGGIRKEANQVEEEGKQLAKVQEDNVAFQQNLIENYQKSYDLLTGERHAIQKEFKTDKIDFNRAWNNRNTGQKIATILGVLVSGLSGNKENSVMQMLNREMDADIDAQKVDIGKNKTLLDHNLQQFGNLRDATNASKLQYLALAEAKLNQIKSTFAGPMAQAKADQMIGALRAQAEPLLRDLSLRQSALKLAGGNGSGASPANSAMLINYLVPEHQRSEAFKEMKELQTLQKGAESALAAFDKVDQMTLGGLFSPNKVNALIDPLVAELSKETAGRFTDTDAQYLKATMRKWNDFSPETRAIKREKIKDLFQKKMVSPILQGSFIPLPRIQDVRPANVSKGMYTQAGYKK